MEQLVARQAHNLEVARSNPASATTKKKSSTKVGLIFLQGLQELRTNNKKIFRSSGASPMTTGLKDPSYFILASTLR